VQETASTVELPLTERTKNVLATTLVRIILQFARNDPQRFLSYSTTRRTLAWLASLYGFDVGDLLTQASIQRALSNLLRSVAEYGVTSPQRLKAPVSVVWSLSYRCNLHCIHCYQNASKPSADELTLDDQLKIIDQIGRAGVSMVVLSGGEPLTNPNLEALIERIRMNDMTISIDSNGVLIDRGKAESLRQAGVTSIELSLDGVDEQSHDHFRGLGGAFKKTLDAVEECSRAGIFTTVATTSTKLNHSKSGDLISLARNRGADRVVFFDLIPAGRGKEVRDLHLSESEIMELMSLVQRESSPDREVFTELPQFVVYSSTTDGTSASDQSEIALSVDRFTVSSFFDCAGSGNIYRKLAPYLGGCPAGRLYCNIQPNGDVTPCMFMPHYPVAGNLREKSFETIWEESEVFKALRDRSVLTGKCRGCKSLIVCGGCRAKAAAYLGDYLASDPTCPIQDRLGK
jgi:radical SAM protein with 4Fe4S-binding SPASM domain